MNLWRPSRQHLHTGSNMRKMTCDGPKCKSEKETGRYGEDETNDPSWYYLSREEKYDRSNAGPDEDGELINEELRAELCSASCLTKYAKNINDI